MAIRAVDMAMPVQRAPEVAQSRDQRPEIQHQQFAQRLSKEAQHQEQSVQQTPQSENANINKDGRGSGGYEGGRSKKKGKKGQQTAKIKQSTSSMLDISI
jgi:hypothetical protein